MGKEYAPKLLARVYAAADEFGIALGGEAGVTDHERAFIHTVLDASGHAEMQEAIEGLLKQHVGGERGFKGQCCLAADMAIAALNLARGELP